MFSSRRNAFFATGLALLISLAALESSAVAAFHLWFIKEAYTNPSGSVQFIELFSPSDSQQFTTGQTLTSNSHTFVFPSDTPTPTGTHHLLLATAGFGSIPGGATPDFTIPANFFSPAGDTLTFALSFNPPNGADKKTFASAPSDGINSLNFTGPFSASTIAANSPRNFNGNGTSVNLAVPEPATIACALIGLTLLLWPRFSRGSRIP